MGARLTSTELAARADDADEIFYVLEANLTFIVGEKRIEAAPGASAYVERRENSPVLPGVARRFTADVDETRVYHGFVPAGFEEMLVAHAAKTELMTVPIGQAPFDPGTATAFGIHVVPG